MCAGQGISKWISVDKQLRELVENIVRVADDRCYYGIYWNDSGEEWEYWTSATADNTATNKYYTLQELNQLLTATNGAYAC